MFTEFKSKLARAVDKVVHSTKEKRALPKRMGHMCQKSLEEICLETGFPAL